MDITAGLRTTNLLSEPQRAVPGLVSGAPRGVALAVLLLALACRDTAEPPRVVVPPDPPPLPDLLWKRLEPASFARPGVNPSASIVYFYTAAQDLLALSLRSGDLIWRSSGGTGASAFASDIVQAGNVVAVGDFDVYAFDAQTGAKLWQRSGPRIGEGTRNIATDGTHFYLTGFDGYLSKVNAATGQDVWSKNLAHGDSAVAGFGPSVFGSVVYVCANRYQDPAITKGSLSAINKETGDVLWRYDYEPTSPEYGNTRCHGPVVEAQGVVVSPVRDGRIVAHDPATGAVRWESPTENATPPTGGEFRYVASDGQHLIATSGNGTVSRIDLATGSVLWRTAKIAGTPLAPPSLGSGIALVSHAGLLASYSLDTGAMHWQRPDRSEYTIGGEPPYRVYFAALVAGGVAFWMGTDGMRAKEIK